MPKGAPGIRRGRRGDVPRRLAELQKLYEQARSGRPARAAAPEALNALAATGDPLAESNLPLAEHLYEVDGAPRRTARLRKLRAMIYGDVTEPVLTMIAHFKQRGGLTDSQAAAEAVVLLAQRNVFLGVATTLPFSRAVYEARKIWRHRKDRPLAPEAWTGKWLFVRPVPGGTVPLPGAPGTYLARDGAWVQDTAFWRQRVAHGDVTVAVIIPMAEDKTPTNDAEGVINSVSPPDASGNE